MSYNNFSQIISFSIPTIKFNTAATSKKNLLIETELLQNSFTVLSPLKDVASIQKLFFGPMHSGAFDQNLSSCSNKAEHAVQSYAAGIAI